jgi:hypothetical protein
MLSGISLISRNNFISIVQLILFPLIFINLKIFYFFPIASNVQMASGIIQGFKFSLLDWFFPVLTTVLTFYLGFLVFNYCEKRFYTKVH